MRYPSLHKPATHLVLRLLIALVLLTGVILVVRPPIARAATITVTTNIDELNSDGDCSLREAIVAANTDNGVSGCAAGSGADTIELPAGQYVLAIAGRNENAAATGDLDITGDLTIVGAGSGSTRILADELDRVLELRTATVTVEGVTIAGGDTASINPVEIGGGALVGQSSSLTLVRSRVTGNAGNGALSLVGQALTLVDSRVDTNSGPGITIFQGAASLLRSEVSANSTGGHGGGVQLNLGELPSSLTVVNSSISGNSAERSGGGIYQGGGSVSLFNATIADNTADADGGGTEGDGGGIFVGGNLLAVARNSIIAGNRDASTSGAVRPNCSGSLSGGGYNLIDDIAGCTLAGNTTGYVTGVAAQLGPLTGNGGPSFTHALLAGSPAIDAGNPAGCQDQTGALLATDQRGLARSGRCDIGAFEFGATAPATPTPTSTAPATATPGPSPTPGVEPGTERFYLPLLQR
jgi:CSLREA domain-containing protein